MNVVQVNTRQQKNSNVSSVVITLTPAVQSGLGGTEDRTTGAFLLLYHSAAPTCRVLQPAGACDHQWLERVGQE